MNNYFLKNLPNLALTFLIFLGASTMTSGNGTHTIPPGAWDSPLTEEGPAGTHEVPEATEDTSASEPEEVKPFRWVALPVVAYDSDLGFQYGLLGQIFLYGDGSTYPEYKHTFYAEVSRFTKGSGVNQFFYDSKYLIPGGIRTTVDISYLTEKALNFYGFNGYQAAYYPEFEDDAPENEDYISRVYYRYERRILRIIGDFQGNIYTEKFRWYAGVSHFNVKTATVDIEKLNKGKDEEDKLPDVPLLYDEYLDLNYIKEDEKDGGITTYLKLGLIYDSRDNEPAPNRGIWSEVVFLAAPSFLGNKPYAFNKIAITHRQYFSLVKNHLVLAYRLGYQGTIGGTAPFYIQPYMYSTYARTTKPDGLGGARTLRGILRNRIVGDAITFGNLELRYKFWKTRLFKQSFYLALYGFGDAGQVLREHQIDRSAVTPEEYPHYFDQDKDSMHFSFGLGLRAVLDENFVLVVDYGIAPDKRDGTSGLYIGVGNTF